MTKVNATMLKALRAVASGRVTRHYRDHGNTFGVAGTTSPGTLWKALEGGLIDDGETISGHAGIGEVVVRMRLTTKGLNELERRQ